ncbi:MAG: phosphatase PAP2 family protein [Cyclobacteriaceae bacterium]
MDTLLALDKDLLLFLNGLHADWLDPVMFYITKTFFWLPLYLFLIFLIVKQEKKESYFALIGVVIMILMTDQITSGFMKPFFARLRPSQEPSLAGILHLVNNYKGGMYGFASGHAANTFAVAMFCQLLLGDRHRYIWLLFVWATVMTYTRIYLGVHYPGDILVGAAIGLTCGWIAFRLAMFLKKRFSRKQA